MKTADLDATNFILGNLVRSLRDLTTALNERGDDTILAWDTGLAASVLPTGKVAVVGIAYAVAWERGMPRTVCNGNGVHTRLTKRSDAIKAYLPQVVNLLEMTADAYKAL